MYILNVHFSLYFIVYSRVINFIKRLPLNATLQLHITLCSGIMVSRINLPYKLAHLHSLCNSYTMARPPVRGDSPRALASGLSYVQVDEHGITISYPYISVELAYHQILRAKDGKDGIH